MAGVMRHQVNTDGMRERIGIVIVSTIGIAGHRPFLTSGQF
jgi:hypothetical protein